MRVFSDPHLGLNRKAHTTPQSRKDLAEAIHEAAFNAASAGNPETAICAGDLFDKFSNSEEVIIESVKVAEQCDLILAGNHDSLNQSDVQGSLDVVAQLLAERTTEVSACPAFGISHVDHGNYEGMDIAVVPHHPTQELFDEAIQGILNDFVPVRAIFFHCNYDNPLASGSDTSLNITEEQVLKLLKFCDYVFIGHEHQPRELLDGRLIITGNPHPTSFGDISDKYYWDLTSTEVTKTLCWEMETGYIEIDLGDGSVWPAPPKNTSFIDITGKLTADKGADLAQFIQDVWHNCAPLMVRNSVEIVTGDTIEATPVDIASLPDQIEGQLKDTPLATKYTYYRGIVKC
jgi:DNA repair exonuclease SbcCD nuclease subunit